MFSLEAIDQFSKELNLKQEENIICILYGSHIYRTHSSGSDIDILALVPDYIPETEKKIDRFDFHSMTYSRFEIELKEHKIKALEAYFSESKIRELYSFELNLVKLRESISEKASHSFVKAKKKIDKEKDTYIGIKSLFHSLRILMFGIQIAKFGKITDFSEANEYFKQLLSEKNENWPYFKEKYQPIYNKLATEFRLLAPKEQI